MTRIEMYDVDVAENLIRWDKFHFVDENWGDQLQREDLKDETEDIIFSASDLYLLAREKDEDFPGMLKMLAIVDPKDADTSFVLVTGVMNIRPLEPILIKKRKKYSDGPKEIISLLEKRLEECITDKQREGILTLKRKVEEFADEEGYDRD